MSRRIQPRPFSVRVGSVLGAILAGALVAAPAASAFSVGPGGKPGLAVDAAGTAYIAWNGPEPLSAPSSARGLDAFVVSAQEPAPGTQLPSFGVPIANGVDLGASVVTVTVAARGPGAS